ncbi:MAG: N-acetyl-gamma-glutamyl-phosphate reductase [Gracilimonas sp.]|uniref:N-acetyl-gamma-glutamyl-phosphate reductase n=1 Tax=Gracilimonas TaxID=649462 RepID=UPI001B01899E|nr:N-acetyl-gamma-glutamyl-phosphate reductase [Gracilimonas sp.]MBO6585110.1 N-acetyl-gamma-glutamyl-phosphate reductase [Gracilimonas sp.]MBO6615619.1 N-acetyl-gamma-glutamyl-phosphate reductase [Gracilimonas sp.]
MIKAGIIGGAGYTAGELIRILLLHPEVELLSVVSRSHNGEFLYTAHPDLEGDTNLKFDSELSQHSDVVFLCSGHGKSKAIVEGNTLPQSAKVIDLSSDYRIKGEHDFIYGLPELNRDIIKTTSYIANPGCFATCIQLCLLPLASKNLLNKPVHITAITGSTGAGQNPTDTTHFSWRSNNASIYKPLKHQHLGEIKQSLEQLQEGFHQPVHFIPMRGAFTRGILATCYLELDESADTIKKLFKEYYAGHPFVTVSDSSPDVKRVVSTNKALIHVQTEDGQVLISGVIDNLLKGASGQAVQNMNLMFGLDETLGLNLKATAF